MIRAGTHPPAKTAIFDRPQSDMHRTHPGRADHPGTGSHADEAILRPQETDFSHSVSAEPHRDRTKQILRRHPEIRGLIGPAQVTFWWIIGLVTLQFGVAWVVADQPLWVMLALAYTIGAFASHALFVMIHECAHRLVFRRRLPNMLAGLVANLPLFVPGAVSFQKYHLKHHAHQGVYDLDADIPSRWEARLVGRSALRKAFWLLLYPVFQAVRSFRVKAVPPLDAWTLTNLAIQIGVNVAVFLLWGGQSLAYLALALFFSIGLHPLGARWIQRHYLVGEGAQETFSYYGALNLLTFNVGYHNEHHDFPSVAWHRLPKIRAAAPEAYADLAAHTSWTRLLLRFLFDPDITLYSRMVREDAAGETLAVSRKRAG
jgi:sphingolipid delta-4 desaturase